MNKSELAKAMKKAREMSGGAFLDAVLEERADLKEKVTRGEVKPSFPGLGYSSYTVIIGDEVFKTSQYDGWPGVDTKDLVLGIERERNLLGYLADKKLPVPKLTYIGRSFSFFGMKRLSGRVLTRRDVEDLGTDDKRNLAKQIAAFCADLANAVPEQEAREMGLDAAPAEKVFESKQLLKDIAAPRVRAALGNRYDFLKQAVEDHIRYREEQPELDRLHVMHCDLKEGNMLWEPATKNFSGGIDFGLSHLTGLESGFKKLYEKYPSDFADMVLEEYGALQSLHLTRQQVQTWASAEYAAYVVEELKAGASPGGLRDYDDYVRQPLRLGPAEKTAAAPSGQKAFFKKALSF
jgi:aminoglycoside phosphotransferase (APT) family kinase protein